METLANYIVMRERPDGGMRIAEGNGGGVHSLQDALTLLASLRFNYPTIQFFVVRVVVVEDVPAILDLDAPVCPHCGMTRNEVCVRHEVAVRR